MTKRNAAEALPSSTERELIYAVLAGLPPGELQPQIKDDQLWQEVESYHQQLLGTIRDFFEGHPAAERDPFFNLLADFYLSFYGIIQGGWRYIEKDIQSKGGFDVLERFRSWASGPGEALIRVLENDCYGMLLPGLVPYFECNPRASFKLNDKRTALSETLAKPKSKRSAKEKQQVRDYEAADRLSRSRYGDLQFFYHGALQICKKYAKKNKNPSLTLRLEAHERTKDALSKTARARAAKRTRQVWKNGKRLHGEGSSP